MTSTSVAKEIGASTYAHNWKYLCGELSRLDLLIRLQLLRQGDKQPASPLDQFRGLVLFETEIYPLLNSSDGDSAKPEDIGGSEYQELTETLGQLETEIRERRARMAEDGTYVPLAHLAHAFQLSKFEQDCLLITLAPELNHKYEKLYAYLHDDVTRKKPSVDLVMSLLLRGTDERWAARAAFDPGASLFRFRLLRMHDGVDGARPLISRFLALDDRMVSFLLGSLDVDARIESAIKYFSPQETVPKLPPEQESIRNAVHSHIHGGNKQNFIICCHGSYGAGKKTFARNLANDLGLPLIIADVSKMLEGPFEETIWLLGREALLQSSLLCLENLDALLTEEATAKSRLEALLEMSRACSWLVFLCSTRQANLHRLLQQSRSVDLPFPIPDAGARKQVWKTLLAEFGETTTNLDFGSLASKFRFTTGQIKDALGVAHNLAQLRTPPDNEIGMKDLEAACRSQSNHKLGTLARKVTPVHSWGDIVLPENLLQQLREICQRVVHRSRVLGDWGFGRKLSLGKGINALFAGPSGTGKTMATEILASELGIDLYKIDLSGVVSKYIGETEKNLDRVFEAAEDANAILFFDEADSLFGKRSEVRDSHDRYANIEISYLLQKMEEYEGLAILATNLKANLDESFTRRLAFTVHFPFPDHASRRLIWEKIWPAEVVLDNEVDLDCLSRQFKLSGGNIKNVALAAAFLAAEDETPVTVAHLLHATGREYQKLGKPLSPDQMVLNAYEEVPA
ncbi:MAG: AAA family ATPase [Pyrinomonadaceae bacterium]|nr:AAA family ATPase [Pyrinomonadaceae bacterium]